MNKSVTLIGGFNEVIELCESEKIKIIGIIDNHKKGNYHGYKIFGDDDFAKDYFISFGGYPVLITPDKPQKRVVLSNYYKAIGFHFINLISSDSIISKSAEIGLGVFIQSRTNISAFVNIGNFVRINTMVNIMHDSKIGNYCSIAPNAVILGNVKIGNFCYIGANSTILPNVNIGNNVVIGAGAVVTKDVSDGITMVGNPALELNKS